MTISYPMEKYVWVDGCYVEKIEQSKTYDSWWGNHPPDIKRHSYRIIN